MHMAPETLDGSVVPTGRSPTTFQMKNGLSCTIRVMVEADAAELCEFMPKSHQESDFLNYLPGEWTMTVEEEVEFIRERKESDKSILLVAEVDGCIVAPPEQSRSSFNGSPTTLNWA